MASQLTVGSCALGLLSLVALCVYTTAVRRFDDTGDGAAVVRLPKPTPTSTHRARTVAYFVVSTALLVLFLGTWSDSPMASYSSAVRELSIALTGSPSQVEGYMAHLYPAAQVLVSVTLLGLAAVIRAPLVRRLTLVAWFVAFVGASIVTQALAAAVGIWTGLPVGPYAIVGFVANLAVGGLVFSAAVFSTFELPNRVSTPSQRPRWPWDTLITSVAILIAACSVAILYSTLLRPGTSDTTVGMFAHLYAGALFLLLPSIFLYLLFRFGERLPDVGGSGPPIDVIVPAFNEESGIDSTLQSIDAAAARYPGRVHVVVSDDGSSDATRARALASISHFEHATGEVISEANGGKSAALNRALALGSAPLVVRLDGDCTMDEWALAYAAAWFGDSTVGSVGAVMAPRSELNGWFAHLRQIECVFQFSFARQGQALVDGLTVIPGTFVMFRRAPAQAIGGFTVGINGEDADLTMQLGRLGYRAVVDPRVRSQEDVPGTTSAFLEQRTRWSRGGLHVFARHHVFRAGLAGPRTWFWTQRRMFAIVAMLMVLSAPDFAAVLLIMNHGLRNGVSDFVVVFVLAALAFLVFSGLLLVLRGHARYLFWLPTWPYFAFLRRLAMLEALISLPCRQVGRMGRHSKIDAQLDLVSSG